MSVHGASSFKVIALVAAILAVLAPVGARAALEEPAPVPAGISADASRTLQTQHDNLERQLQALMAAIQTHNQRCSSVAETDTARVQECQTSQARLSQQIADYKSAVAAYDAALREAQAAPAGATGLASANVQASGAFYVLTSDGRKLDASAASRVTPEAGTTFITGQDGHAKVTFSDGTKVDLQPNTQFVIDTADYSGSSLRALAAELKQGVLRWVSGVAQDLSQPPQHTIRTRSVVVAVRGTDFELAVAANGADTIKLYKGALDVTRPDGTGLVRLQAGHMMTIGADGALGAPAPL